MLCASNIVTILLLFKSISGLPPLYPNLGFAQYQRSLPEANVPQGGKAELLMPANKVHSGENMQKLVPTYDSSIQEDGNNGFEVPHNVPSKQPPKKIADRETAPENVHRVQEMTGLLWPMGVVPYYIDKDSYDTTTRKRIVKAMGAVEAVSCVIFRELEKKPDGNEGAWLHFTNPKKEKECRHMFEVIDGGSEVALGFECLRPEEILHSLLHALGFRDEVTHPQRDQYIRVMWDNIQPKYRDLFRIRYEDAAYKLVEYDPMSIMHFHDRAFSDNGAATIVTLVPGLHLTSTTVLSQLDIMRLKLAFSHECNKRNVGDLLDTCKNSLWKEKQPDLSNETESESETPPVAIPEDHGTTVSSEEMKNSGEKSEHNGSKSENIEGTHEKSDEKLKKDDVINAGEPKSDGVNEEEKTENNAEFDSNDKLKLKKGRFSFQSVNNYQNNKG